MARPRPKKKPKSTSRVLPMELRIGDRLVDETGEWQVVGRPYHVKRREECSRARPASRPARRHRDPDLERPRADRGEASMNSLRKLAETVRMPAQGVGQDGKRRRSGGMTRR